MSTKSKKATGNDSLPFFQLNPALAPSVVSLDTDNINEITVIKKLITKDVNGNKLADAENAFVAYVVRYNSPDRFGVGSACAPGAHGKGVVANKKALVPHSVNAIIPELNLATPLPARFIEAHTKKTVVDLCNRDIADADRVINMAPVFEIPANVPDTIRPGNFVVVSLYDKTAPSKGGTVKELVKDQNGEIKLSPLKSRGGIIPVQVTPCPEVKKAGADATGDNPHPNTKNVDPSSIIVAGDLLIIKKHDVLEHYRKRGKKKPPGAIMYHYTVTNSPASTIRVFNRYKRSSHYEIDRDGTVYEYLDPTYYVAYHGGKRNNTPSIGVDLTWNASCPEPELTCWPEKQVLAAKKLTAYLCKKYSINPVVAPFRRGNPKKRRPPSRKDPRPQGAPTGLATDGHKNTIRVPEWIKSGYTLLRHNSCVNSATGCPGDLPLERMVPTSAEMAAINTTPKDDPTKGAACSDADKETK